MKTLSDLLRASRRSVGRLLSKAESSPRHRRIDDLVQLCEDRLRTIEELRADNAGLQRSRTDLLDRLSILRSASAPYRGSAIPVVIGIDVEPDARVVDRGNPSWDATAVLFRKMDELRDRFASVCGQPLQLTWFPRADAQVEIANGNAGWALEHFAAEWNAAQRRGDEIGLHVHPWRWDQAADTWFQDHADEDWVAACILTALGAYRQAFGRTPAAYRGGDRYLSNGVVGLLQAEGVRLDLTLERMPGVARLAEAERGTGSIPDGMHVPQRAYWPSSSDFRAPDPDRTSGIAMLPLTAHENRTLTPWLSNTVFETALDDLLCDGADSAEDPTHLAFVIRSDLANSPLWDVYVDNVLSLARRVREGRLLSRTASGSWDCICQRLSAPIEAGSAQTEPG